MELVIQKSTKLAALSQEKHAIVAFVTNFRKRKSLGITWQYLILIDMKMRGLRALKTITSIFYSLPHNGRPFLSLCWDSIFCPLHLSTHQQLPVEPEHCLALKFPSLSHCGIGWPTTTGFFNISLCFRWQIFSKNKNSTIIMDNHKLDTQLDTMECIRKEKVILKGISLW